MLHSHLGLGLGKKMNTKFTVIKQKHYSLNHQCYCILDSFTYHMILTLTLSWCQKMTSFHDCKHWINHTYLVCSLCYNAFSWYLMLLALPYRVIKKSILWCWFRGSSSYWHATTRTRSWLCIVHKNYTSVKWLQQVASR